MTLSSIAQDFIDLFDGNKKAHLAKYIYLYRPHIYDAIVNSERYYLYHLENRIIQSYSDQIMADLKGISHVIEVGPGSSSPVISKTVPSIQALKQHCLITHYSAIDTYEKYAIGASEIIAQNFSNINTRPIVSDLFGVKLEHLNDRLSKVILCFGGTIFCNSIDSELDNNLKSVSALLNEGEHFIFGLDTNNKKDSILLAYYNDLVHELLLNTMHVLKIEFGLANFDPTAFDLIFEWDEKKTQVVLYLRSQRTQEIVINDYPLTIKKGVCYNILDSKKCSLENVKLILNQYNLEVADSFVDCDKFGNEFSIVKGKKLAPALPV